MLFFCSHSQKEKKVGSTCGVLSFYWYCSSRDPPIMHHDAPWWGCCRQCGGPGTGFFSELCNLNPGDLISYIIVIYSRRQSDALYLPTEAFLSFMKLQDLHKSYKEFLYPSLMFYCSL